jgi:putative heme iron utilization protein
MKGELSTDWETMTDKTTQSGRAPTPEEAKALAVADAKRLIRTARTGALATFDDESRMPLATLIGVASDWDGAPLFLMSELSRHTRNLAAHPRASLLLSSPGGRGDPLNQPRLTVGGPIGIATDPSAKARYLRRNPKAKLYAGFGDFSVRRMSIETVHFNGGFGRAGALQPQDILVAGDASALIACEDALIADVQSLGGEKLLALAGGAASGRRVWRAVGIDAEGFELGAGSAVVRVPFSTPEFEPQAWRLRLAG